jgi:hypothetical protein
MVLFTCTQQQIAPDLPQSLPRISKRAHGASTIHPMIPQG